jgi:hypothetical protein
MVRISNNSLPAHTGVPVKTIDEASNDPDAVPYVGS